MTADGRLLRGERTRAAVLERTLRLASVDGLDGLSLARVADTLGVSKSGLFAHWRSKEALQLAVIDHAREQWIAAVTRPARAAPPGLRRLWATHDRRLAFYESGLLPGGCFFGNAYFEFNARPGVIRERLVAEVADWLRLLTSLSREAVDLGELPPGTDPVVLAHLVDALGIAAAMQTPVLGAATSCGQSRLALLAHLRAIATDPTILPETS